MHVPLMVAIGRRASKHSDRMRNYVISCNPEVMGGTAEFSGTRVPVQTLLDYLEVGESVDEFLEGFPSVSREHVIAFARTTVWFWLPVVSHVKSK